MNKAKRTIILIFSACLLPILASYFLYYIFRPSSFTNYGLLITPPKTVPDNFWSLSHITSEKGQKELTLQSSIKGKWILVSYLPDQCADTCQKTFFYLNQLKIAMGENTDRVAVLALNLKLIEDNKEGTLEEKYPVVLTTSPSSTARMTFETFFESQSLTLNSQNTNPQEPIQPLQRIWLIDPLGNWMMFYPNNSDPNKIKKDLNKLLKSSRIG
jgi:cytochrome oxidase Cu insertion factor (SCO1/SenC/PrrC family)